MKKPHTSKRVKGIVDLTVTGQTLAHFLPSYISTVVDINQIIFRHQTINRMTHSLKEAESRSEKLENDIYDMKRELAEETKRFRDKWRDAKKKER